MWSRLGKKDELDPSLDLSENIKKIMKERKKLNFFIYRYIDLAFVLTPRPRSLSSSCVDDICALKFCNSLERGAQFIR